jgi:hypothetical protein
MTILGPPDAAFGIDLGGGFEFAEAGGVTHLGLQSQLMGLLGNFGFLLKTNVGLAEHEEAFLNEGEVFLLREFNMEASAFEREIAEEFPGPGNVALGGVYGKEPDPAGKRGRESGAEEEGALWIKHPLESLRNDTRCSKGNKVRRHNHAGVPFGATLSEGVVPFDDANRVISFGKVVADRETDHSAAYDEDFLGHGKRTSNVQR